MAEKSNQELADAILNAYKTVKTIPPIRNFIEGQDISKAYKIQSLVNSKRVKNGAKMVGKKIGLTSKAVQKQLGVDQPDFGVLFDVMQIENDNTLNYSETMQPKVEAEIAFILKNDLLKKNNSIPEIEAAIDYAKASIEIVGSRIENWNINILDTIADNASASHFVLGKNQMKLADIDLVNCKMELSVNGELESEGSGKACLGSPLNAVKWLADRMTELGNPLKAGEIILSGALGPMVTIKPGDRVAASIEGLGIVELNFSN